MFEGSYKEGKKNGAGVMKLSNGDVIKGLFQDDFLTGIGNSPNNLSNAHIFK